MPRRMMKYTALTIAVILSLSPVTAVKAIADDTCIYDDLQYIDTSISLVTAVDITDSLLDTSVGDVDSISAEQSDRLSNVINEKVNLIALSGEGTNLKISQVKTIKDFSNNDYLVIECEPSGYLIFHNQSGKFVEYSELSPSPYLGFWGDNLYYGGPTEYWYLDGDQFYHTVIDEWFPLRCLDEAASICDQANQLFNSDADYDVLQYVETGIGTDTIQPYALAAASYITNASQISNLTTASQMGYFSGPNGGACGYIAAGLLMIWHKTTINNKYLTVNNSTGKSYTSVIRNLTQFNADPTNYSNGDNFAYNLWRWHSGKGQSDYLNGDFSTTAYRISSTLSSYTSTLGMSIRSITHLIPGTENIINFLGNDRPYLLFGRLSLTGGTKQDHAVTVYGHQDGKLIAHFGWSGYANNFVEGLWGTGYQIFGE